MKSAIAGNPQTQYKSKARDDSSWERRDATDSALPINHHHLIRTGDFSLPLPAGHLGSALRVQEGHVNS
jgi:hypothetical protein